VVLVTTSENLMRGRHAQQVEVCMVFASNLETLVGSVGRQVEVHRCVLICSDCHKRRRHRHRQDKTLYGYEYTP
jgi:hypothetical protein